MLVNFVIGFVGMLFVLFIFWKKLKEDYSSEIIFKSSFAIIIGILIGWGIAVRFVPSAFLWLSVIGGLSGLGYANNIHKIRFYETFDAFIIAGLPWISLVF